MRIKINRPKTAQRQNSPHSNGYSCVFVGLYFTGRTARGAALSVLFFTRADFSVYRPAPIKASVM